MARRKAKRKRGKRAFSVINGIESYAYASVLTGAFANTTPFSFITGEADVTTGTYNLAAYEAGSTTGSSLGVDAISLGDIAKRPDLSFEVMKINIEKNWMGAVGKSIGIGITFRLLKSLLRKPIANVNRNIFTPLLGKGTLRL